ncbi:MAG: acyl dehydratase, partial [Deltaproteobacteria bacterium]|nr:acyl dehydratase [Deltaproteobacteria bacterium]
MDRTFFEDLEVGDRFGGERFVVDGEEMLEFARRWDPRPIHVDDAAGKEAGFGEAIASGACTTSIYT